MYVESTIIMFAIGELLLQEDVNCQEKPTWLCVLICRADKSMNSIVLSYIVL